MEPVQHQAPGRRPEGAVQDLPQHLLRPGGGEGEVSGLGEQSPPAGQVRSGQVRSLSLHQQTLTNTDWTACSPCPAEERSSWSEWGEWRIPESHLQYCGPGQLALTRERACVRGKRRADCEGEDRQTKTVPKPACKGEHTGQEFGQDMEVSGSPR